MKMRKPLTDEDGEVRELLLEDIKRFRPIAEGLSPPLAAKLGVEVPSTNAEKMPTRKRKSGIPTGNAGEYFAMGELLRRGFDAQLADRNTKTYDLLVGRPEEATLSKVQVKTVRAQPWYVNTVDFEGELLDRVTIYVLVGPEHGRKPVRFFIARNRDLAGGIHHPVGWKKHGFMNIKALERHENRWDALLP
jgi:hypothetical protein